MSAVDLYRSGPITNPRPARERLDYPNYGDISGGAVLVYFGYVPEINPLESGSYGDGAVYTYDSLDIVEKIDMQSLSTVETSPYAFTDPRLTHVIANNYGSGYDPIVYLPDASDNYTIVVDPSLYTVFYYPEADTFVLYFSIKPKELAYDASGMPTKQPKITCYKYISLVGLENFVPTGTGSQGPQGLQGRQGMQGFQGLQGSGVQGPQGLQGSSGENGLQGLQGPQGQEGVFIVSETAPLNPTPGTTWFNCATGREFIWYDNYWVESGTSWSTEGTQGFQGFQGEEGLFIVSETAPVSPSEGTTWFDCVSGRQFIWYDNYWVESGTSWATVGTQGFQGFQGEDGIFMVSETAPTNPIEGMTWFDCATGKEFIWYDNYWVEFGTSWATLGAQGLQGFQGLQGIGIQGPQGATGSGGGGLVGTNYIFVQANGTDIQNATQLQNAYNAAKLMSPSLTNRITIVAAPGYYNLGSAPFIMDTQYIDLVSFDGNLSVVFNSLNSAGTIQITANDVFVKGIDVGTKNFTIATSLNLLRVDTCRGGSNSFGSGVTVSGAFTRCQGGFFSFGGGAGGNASGAFIDCGAGDFSFGGNGGTASGTFTNCRSSFLSFGGAGTASGTFTDCRGFQIAFGGIGTASGTFTDCQGGATSFGSSMSGRLYYCRLTSGGFPAPTGSGRIVLCIDGNNNIVNLP